MLYSTVIDGCYVPVCLEWMLGLGCAYQFRVHHQLTCCPALRKSHTSSLSVCQSRTEAFAAVIALMELLCCDCANLAPQEKYAMQEVRPTRMNE